MAVISDIDVSFNLHVDRKHCCIVYWLKSISVNLWVLLAYLLHKHNQVNDSNLKGKQGHNYGHPADCHGDVCTALLGNDIHGAQEEHRPDDVIEHHQTQEGHENPQRNAHHLEKTRFRLS